jgi:urea transport system permease protein
MKNGSFFKRESAGLLMAFLLLLLIPVLNLAGVMSDLSLNLLGRYLCFAMVAIGIDLIWGYTGILSLCQALFFSLGGYCIGMHMLLKTGTQGTYGSALPDFMVWTGVTELPWFWKPFSSFPAMLSLGLLVPAVAAFAFGFFAFRSRIKGVYFSIISQALALAAWLIFLRNETRLGGTNGLTDFKTLLGFQLANPETKRALYLFTALVLVLVYFACRFAIRSKFGKILVAIRDSETRVRFTGISVARYKTFIFAAAALLAGIGGMLYVPQTGIITPGRMDVRSSLEMVVWVAVGGRATLMGPIIGAIGISLLYSFLTGTLPGSWLYVLGGLFIVVVLFMPRGVTGAFGDAKAFVTKRLAARSAKRENEGDAS